MSLARQTKVSYITEKWVKASTSFFRCLVGSFDSVDLDRMYY